MKTSLKKIYARAMSKHKLSILNDYMLKLALSARGYNNYHSSGESGEKYFIEEILSPSEPELCIDIGASTGLFSQELLSRTGADVIGFEPNPVQYEKLALLSHQYPGRFTAEKIGIGLKYEQQALFFNPEALDHASFMTEVNAVEYVDNSHSTQAQMMPLDMYCERHNINKIDFIKIDVEGLEVDVLRGAQKTIRRVRPKYIQVEFNWHQLYRGITFWSLAKLLNSYDTYQLVPGGWQKRLPGDPLTNLFLFSNFVFVRAEHSQR